MKTAASTLILGLTGFASLATASWPENFGEAAMQWSYDTPDGGEVTFNGTVEEANAQFEALYPGLLAAGQTQPELETRQEDSPFAKDITINCFPAGGNSQGWERADLGRLEEGWNHLNNVQGKPTAGPGPGQCARVSCSYNSAIYWCNDNDHDYELESFQQIGIAAAEICSQCTGNFIFKDCGGQLFSADGINVINRKDSC